MPKIWFIRAAAVIGSARLAFRVVLLVVAFMGFSCRPSGEAAGGDLPCGVRALLAERCWSCHGETPAFGAPMPLVTHADLHAPSVSDASRPVYELVAARVRDEEDPMPQRPYPKLDSAELAALDAWILAAAPGSDETCAAAEERPPTSIGCTPDLHLRPRTPWVMPKTADDAFGCYGVDVASASKRHVVGMAPHVDNEAIVHHVSLYQSDAPVSPVLAPCPSGGAAGWRLMAVWTPGADGVELPPAAGFPLEGTTHYVVQIHYSNLKHLSDQVDETGYDLCTTDTPRPHDADVLVLGADDFTVPAHGSLDITCDFPVPEELHDVHMVSALPHMHEIGKEISTVQLPHGKGVPVDLGRRAPWDYEAQYWSPVDAVLEKDDVIRTRCAWDNPGNVDVTFGSGTADEMCWSYTLYYPKVSAPGWSFTLPSQRSVCKPSP